MAKLTGWFKDALHAVAETAARHRVEVAAVTAKQKKAADEVKKTLLGIGYTVKKGGQAGYEKLYQGDTSAQQALRRAMKDLGFTFDSAAVTSTSMWFDHPTLGRVESKTGATSDVWLVRHILPIR